VPAGLGQVGVQFGEFGTRLNFLPIVLGNGRIHLEVEPEVSVLDAAAGTSIAGAVVPGRATQRVHTTVEMETGQTFVIGGLIQRELIGNANKVPVIGQVPYLGALFSQKTMTEVETELVVMVTPHLVDAQSACQVGKVLPGQETRTPDDYELFLEGILEAPRGPREVFKGNRYVPPHFNGPTAELFPCAGRGDGMHQMPITPAGGHGVGTHPAMQPAPAMLNGHGINGHAAPIGGPQTAAPLGPTNTAPPTNSGAVTPSGGLLPEAGDLPVTPAGQAGQPAEMPERAGTPVAMPPLPVSPPGAPATMGPAHDGPN
jgi:pilus assembly protein CpaC